MSNKLKKMLSISCFVLLFINFFFKMMLINKISIGIILLLTGIVLYFDAIEKITNKMISAVILTIVIFTLPFCYYFGFENYKIYSKPILYEETIDNVTYQFNNIDATFYINGTGKTIYLKSSYDMPWRKYIKGILHVEISDEIIRIGDSLFCECNKIKDVRLGDNIISIGNFAFNKCSDLTSFNTDKKNSLIIPKNCSAIGDFAFYECNKIKNVYIPKSIIYLGENSLNISSLEKIYFEGSESEWNNIVKQNNAIPKKCKIYFNKKNNDL